MIRVLLTFLALVFAWVAGMGFELRIIRRNYPATYLMLLREIQLRKKAREQKKEGGNRGGCKVDQDHDGHV